MNDEPDFRQILKGIRLALGLTQKQLATKLGVTFATVNGWENGRHEPMPLLAASIMAMAGAVETGELRKDSKQAQETKPGRTPRRRRTQ